MTYFVISWFWQTNINWPEHFAILVNAADFPGLPSWIQWMLRRTRPGRSSRPRHPPWVQGGRATATKTAQETRPVTTVMRRRALSSLEIKPIKNYSNSIKLLVWYACVKKVYILKKAICIWWHFNWRSMRVHVKSLRGQDGIKFIRSCPWSKVKNNKCPQGL